VAAAACCVVNAAVAAAVPVLSAPLLLDHVGGGQYLISIITHVDRDEKLFAQNSLRKIISILFVVRMAISEGSVLAAAWQASLP